MRDSGTNLADPDHGGVNKSTRSRGAIESSKKLTSKGQDISQVSCNSASNWSTSAVA